MAWTTESRPVATYRDFASLGLEVAVRSAGFREVCAYWVEPSLAIPRNLIPAREVASANSRQCEPESGVATLPMMAVAARLDAVLYPALLIVAKA